MWDGTEHMDDWWWLMALLMVACWALVIWGVTMLVRCSRRTRS
jgi:hypothetical protein